MQRWLFSNDHPQYDLEYIHGASEEDLGYLDNVLLRERLDRAREMCVCVGTTALCTGMTYGATPVLGFHGQSHAGAFDASPTVVLRVAGRRLTVVQPKYNQVMTGMYIEGNSPTVSHNLFYTYILGISALRNII